MPTRNQPTLPAEQPWFDAEHAFMDDSPAGLFPENQNSNFGSVIRRVLSEPVQDIIDQQTRIYRELFISTSSEFLDEWEKQFGLPLRTGAATDQARRAFVQARMQKGLFSRAARRRLVENYITSTFGDAIQLTDAGAPLSAAGTPLFSGAGSLAGTYAIRENWPEKNLIPNSNFETNILGWNNNNFTALAQSNAQARYGTQSLRATTGANTSPSVSHNALISVTAGQSYAWSYWAYTIASGFSPAQAVIQWYDNTPTLISTSVGSIAFPANQWVRPVVVAVAPAGATQALPLMQMTGAPSTVNVYFDGAQFEVGTAATDWNDPSGQSFYYEVRILNTVGVDQAGLARELNRITPAHLKYDIVFVPVP